MNDEKTDRVVHPKPYVVPAPLTRVQQDRLALSEAIVSVRKAMKLVAQPRTRGIMELTMDMLADHRDELLKQ